MTYFNFQALKPTGSRVMKLFSFPIFAFDIQRSIVIRFLAIQSNYFSSTYLITLLILSS